MDTLFLNSKNLGQLDHDLTATSVESCLAWESSQSYPKNISFKYQMNMRSMRLLRVFCYYYFYPAMVGIYHDHSWSTIQYFLRSQEAFGVSIFPTNIHFLTWGAVSSCEWSFPTTTVGIAIINHPPNHHKRGGIPTIKKWLVYGIAIPTLYDITWYMDIWMLDDLRFFFRLMMLYIYNYILYIYIHAYIYIIYIYTYNM